MRALADFVMRGRYQAIGVAMLASATSIFAWVGAAVVALVILRRGPGHGLVVLGWSLLPALAVALWRADLGALTVLIGGAVAALVLRRTVSWPLALVAAVAAGLLTALLLHVAGNAYVDQLIAALRDAFEELRERVPEGQGGALVEPARAQITGLLALSTTVTSVLSLLLARWWQAMLYNPGGFRKEFHRLRLPPLLAAGLIAAGILATLPGPDYRLWAALFAVPFTVAGFALAHGAAGLKGWGRGPLVALYVSWLLFGWVKVLLLLLALVDSWVDIRGRLARRAE
jgi:hypothetical protein